MTATRHRLWDQRGQTLPVALLAAMGVLIPLFVGGWGLTQWLSVRARAQAAADAAALAAAAMAEPVVDVAVTYEDQQCRLAQRKWTCRPGPQRQAELTLPVGSVDQGTPPLWARDVGCAVVGAGYAGGGRVCLSARQQGAAYWTYPDQGSTPYSPAAAEAAQQYLQANLHQPFAITGFATENGGPGTAQVSLRVTVPGSPLGLWRRGPVVVDVYAAADPRYGMSGG